MSHQATNLDNGLAGVRRNTKPRPTVIRYGTMLRIFDNGGETFDRYTILPSRFDKKYRDGMLVDCVGASEFPFHPQGFGQWSQAQAGHHLGKRVHIDALPTDVQKFARQSFPEYFN